MSAGSSTSKPQAAELSKELNKADKPVKRSNILIKHGKYVVVGGLGTWYTGIPQAIEGVWTGPGGWIRKTLVGAVACHAFTVLVFLYLVVFLPYIRGYIPHYPKWEQSARLRIIVPLLTAAILFGWTGYVVALSQAGKRSPLNALGDAVKGVGEADLGKLQGGKGLGVLSAMAGTTAMYTLTIGLLGFIQAPPNTPVRKQA